MANKAMQALMSQNAQNTMENSMLNGMGFGNNPIQQIFGFAQRFRGMRPEQIENQVMSQIQQMGGISKQQFAQFEQMANMFGPQLGVTPKMIASIKTKLNIK